MTSQATSAAEYLQQLPEDRKATIAKLRDSILLNLPPGFEETMGSGMLNYVVPHSLYPAGYHCDPKQPLPFAALASQKNFIAFYHMGIYAMPDLLEWFTSAYANHSTAKLDMGKSCIRFKKPEHIPYKLIGELVSKVSVSDWINVYEQHLRR
ncbi:DUF1801 domain-containing protein [Segetibacter sp. 3557_3]|uniref:DUF1801 domain-containing protein n=1 Tax=Segetibacter sp. 3557_3 TaxID=2547429 RepID=UPI001058816C|nr:DUF1801 domain-containing protein [Segetibacter sp. 3557_3]TDH25595.1 DUF1801 domain-containing protein [Segetibacter sp. 3557_3]